MRRGPCHRLDGQPEASSSGPQRTKPRGSARLSYSVRIQSWPRTPAPVGAEGTGGRGQFGRCHHPRAFSARRRAFPRPVAAGVHAVPPATWTPASMRTLNAPDRRRRALPDGHTDVCSSGRRSEAGVPSHADGWAALGSGRSPVHPRYRMAGESFLSAEGKGRSGCEGPHCGCRVL